MPWSTPVYDRTPADLYNKTAKAYLNASDLQRIEDNIAQLGALLSLTIPVKTWTEYDFPTLTGLNRIIGNLQTVSDTFYPVPGAPSLPMAPYLHYEKLNDLERITALLYPFILGNTRRCYAGEPYLNDLGVI